MRLDGLWCLCYDIQLTCMSLVILASTVYVMGTIYITDMEKLACDYPTRLANFQICYL